MRGSSGSAYRWASSQRTEAALEAGAGGASLEAVAVAAASVAVMGLVQLRRV